MRHLLFSAVIVGAGWVALAPAMANSLSLPGLSGPKVTTAPIEKVGYWKRQYRRYGYPHPMSTIRRPTATIRLPPRTPIRHLFMATNRPRPRMPILHPCMAIRPLRRPPAETTRPQKATTATIRPQRETIHRPAVRRAIIRLMALSALS